MCAESKRKKEETKGTKEKHKSKKKKSMYKGPLSLTLCVNFHVDSVVAYYMTYCLCPTT